MTKLPIERLPLRDVVYARILTGIVNGTYQPGDHLREEVLAEEMGISSTPVREALRRLESERFVNYFPRKGSVVSEVPVDEVEDLYRVRQLLEVLIIRRAAEKATPEDIERLRALLEEEAACTEPDEIFTAMREFNEALNALSQADNLITLNKRARESLRRVLNMNHLAPGRRDHSREEHKLIIGALEAHDADLAEKYTIEHLSHSLRPALEMARRRPNGGIE